MRAHLDLQRQAEKAQEESERGSHATGSVGRFAAKEEQSSGPRGAHGSRPNELAEAGGRMLLCIWEPWVLLETLQLVQKLAFIAASGRGPGHAVAALRAT